MKVWVEGWKRVVNTTILLERKLTELHGATYPLPPNEARCVAFDTLDFSSERPTTDGPRVWGEQVVTGGVRIAAKTMSSVALQGDFEVNVELSADELLLLAAEATKNWPSGYLLERLAALRPSKSES